MTPAEVPDKGVGTGDLLAVRLSSYEWHALLKELEHALCIVNRDRHNPRVLYNSIASQLAGRKIEVEVRLREDEKETVPAKPESWLKRFFG